VEKIHNFINGEFYPANSNNYLDVFEPATGQVYAKVTDSNSDDILYAVKSAQSAFDRWSNLSIEKRSNYLINISNEIENRLDEFAEYESRDTGKPISLARSIDIPRAISNFRFFANFGLSFQSEYYLNSDQSKNRVVRYPLGVVGCISPWNLPLYLFTWKIAPALIVGNTVLAKPSELTPYSAYKLGEICKKIELPPGVLNIIHGRGETVGDSIVTHPSIKAISFTGGTKTGKLIANQSSSSFKKISLEMGGKNPAIVFDNYNYDKMLETMVKSSFSNQGQICLCSSRLLIEKSMYDQFKIDFIEKVKNLRIGDPNNFDTEYGAISSLEHFDKIMNYISLAKKSSGTVLIGGNSVKIDGRCDGGWFIEPTIIEGLSNLNKINKDEIFGPVVTLQKFTTEEEAINLANETDYGLSATIWSKDKIKANRVADQIDAGIIWINSWLIRDLRTPFGGMKQSGLGREGGEDVLLFFTETKNICMLD
tara:strand:- start:248 stop:1690 length:1443 start_codon:yes stop_codon:yes gene_type:complete